MIQSLAALERGHEARFALHQELVYKVFARRNQLFAEWAATLMGYHGDGVSAYAREVLDHVFGDADIRCLLRKVEGDLARLGVVLPENRLEDKLYEIEGGACRDVLDAMVRTPVVPERRRVKAGMGESVRVAADNGVQAIEQALSRAKSELASRPPLHLRDLFLSMVGSGAAFPAE